MGKLTFVTATDTGVGKTTLTRLLTRALRRRGVDARALKPFETGCRMEEGHLVGEDGTALAEASGLEPGASGFFKLSLPLAPSVAGRLEGQRVPVDEALAWIEGWRGRCAHLLVEGVGGVMVPLDDSRTVLELMEQMRPDRVLLVAENRLGVLSQVLAAVTVMRGRGFEPEVLLSSHRPEPGLAEQTNADELRRWGVRVVEAACLEAGHEDAQGEALLAALGWDH